MNFESPQKRAFLFAGIMRKFPSLKKNTEYRTVYREGSKRAFRNLCMYVFENGTDHNRLGISVSHRVGNSVVRHTFARRMREIFRKFNLETVQGKDIVVVAGNRAKEASFQDLLEDYYRLLSIHKML